MTTTESRPQLHSHMLATLYGVNTVLTTCVDTSSCYGTTARFTGDTQSKSSFVHIPASMSIASRLTPRNSTRMNSSGLKPNMISPTDLKDLADLDTRLDHIQRIRGSQLFWPPVSPLQSCRGHSSSVAISSANARKLHRAHARLQVSTQQRSHSYSVQVVLYVIAASFVTRYSLLRISTANSLRSASLLPAMSLRNPE